jgi:spore coat protein CotH
MMGTFFAFVTPMVRSVHSSSILASLILVALAACGSGDPGDEPGADAGVDTYADGDWLFESDRVLSIDIEMVPADWDSLRFQTRKILDIFGDGCGDGPAPEAFTYFSATVTIEGETFQEVGVRKKGFLGSLSETKPSLKLKLDKFIPDQKMSGLKRFTLNNSVQDPSYVNQCLGYDLFRAAGVPAPRCNFASVTVNGQAMGVYVNIEAVKKPFLRMHFGNDTGDLYEGTISDFRDGWTATFEKKTNELTPGQPGVDDLQAALALDGDPMRAALDPRLDIDAFMKFWAVEILVAHGDGYSGNSNNFYFYDNLDTNQIVFMPWGADNLFSDSPGSIGASKTRSLLPRKLFLHDESRAQYVAAMTEVLDTVWDDQAMLAEIDRMEALISSYVLTDEQDAFATDLTALRATIDGREAEVRGQLGGLTAGSADSLMDPLCFTRSGTITGSFGHHRWHTACLQPAKLGRGPRRRQPRPSRRRCVRRFPRHQPQHALHAVPCRRPGTGHGQHRQRLLAVLPTGLRHVRQRRARSRFCDPHRSELLGRSTGERDHQSRHLADAVLLDAKWSPRS